jgi:hypothetical protein
MQVVSTNPDIGAGLRVGTGWAVYVAVASWRAVRSTAINSWPSSIRPRAIGTHRSADAAQMPIIVRDISAAIVVVIKFSVMPVSVRCPATRMQVISLYMDFLAGLQIRA